MTADLTDKKNEATRWHHLPKATPLLVKGLEEEQDLLTSAARSSPCPTADNVLSSEAMPLLVASFILFFVFLPRFFTFT